ncbi:MAG: hypothetical protein AAB358_03785 [Patescibacteria group bacterium]
MALTATQQIFELIKKSQSILIAFKSEWAGDDLASALALAEFFKKIGKSTEVVCSGFKPSAELSFLPLEKVKSQLGNLEKFVITVETAKTPIGEFYYEKGEDQLRIYLTPEVGQLQPENISAKSGGFKYDLIFIVNSPDLESLGEIYEKHGGFFYATPKVNLDHDSRNERFGNVNLVDLASASTAEIVYRLIKEYDEGLMDENIATSLLSGIILATKNFKTPEVTPQTLNEASLLILAGAKREEIIKHLYQNRFLSTLRLWGRILSRLNSDLDGKLVWSSVASQDFVETASSPAEVTAVIDELITSLPKTKVAIIFCEKIGGEEKAVEGIVYSAENLDSLYLVKKFQPEGNSDLARFSLPASLAEAERMVMEEVKDKLKV